MAFQEVDSTLRRSLDEVKKNPNVLQVTETEGMLPMLEENNAKLETILKGVLKQVEVARKACPRFEF